jgi:hypothetical protein
LTEALNDVLVKSERRMTGAASWMGSMLTWFSTMEVVGVPINAGYERVATFSRELLPGGISRTAMSRIKAKPCDWLVRASKGEDGLRAGTALGSRFRQGRGMQKPAGVASCVAGGVLVRSSERGQAAPFIRE